MFRRWFPMLGVALLLAFGMPLQSQIAPLERDEPPRADRIRLIGPDEQGFVVLEGDLQSVVPAAVVGIRDLFTGETAFVQAGYNGAFTAQVPGVPGNPYWIQTDNDFPPAAQRGGPLPGDIGTIVTAPLVADRFAFAGLRDGQRWTASGALPALTLEPGTAWPLRIEIATPSPDPFAATLVLQPLAQAQAGVLQPVTVAGSSGWAAETTSAGLPLDGMASPLELGDLSARSPVQPTDSGYQFSLAFNGALPDDLLDGLYAPALRLDDGSLTRLPLVLRAGDAQPARLTMALFMDTGMDGARGLLPDEAVGSLSHGARWNGPDFILPPGNYPLEPYLPALLPNQSDTAAPPLIPFDLPGGELRVRVLRPDGQTEEFSAPFTQTRLGTEAQDEATRFGGGPTNVLRLTTGQASLTNYAFDHYGAYTIELEADLTDRFGNVYTGGGAYHLLIAEPLDLASGLLPGSPIPAGAAVDAGLHITPPVPADVSASLTVVDLSGEAKTTRLSAAANRYGAFTPANAFIPETPGSYVMDYTATYTDEGGRLWAGSLRNAGVVADPDTPLVVHGGRGLTGQPSGDAPARYSLRALAGQADVAELSEPIVLNQPFYADTTARLGDGTAFGLAFPFHLQDTEGPMARALIEQSLLDEQTAARGEIPAAIPGVSVAYVSAVTPGFSVRQQVLGGDAESQPQWVSADDSLNQQIGAGVNGLAEGDLVFLFGGVIAGEPGTDERTAAGYASLAVIGDDDPDQLGVFAPRQGPAPLAFVPTGLLPGQRLTAGESLVVAGHVAPPIPATVTAEFTRPDGTTETVMLQANAFGYAFDPEAALTADQEGVWTVRLTAGTAAGEAGVPGATDATFNVYVLPEDAEPLPWNPLLRDTDIPGATAYNIAFTAPDGWENVQAYRTMTMPGTILADGEARLAGRSLTSPYNPVEIQEDFPNFEVEGRTSGPSVSDPVTLTLVFTGTDADGNPRIQARTLTFLHDRLLSLENGESAP